MLGLAKKKLFGGRPSRWPQLQRLVEQGVLLDIDLAYAATQVPDGSEREAATHAALLAALRRGHLCLTKETVDPFLADLIEEHVSLPKYDHFENQIVSHIQRLISQTHKKHPSTTDKNLTSEQNIAVDHALIHCLSLITGGPGTGKTHTAAYIVDAFKTTPILAAPTGKAAAHLESKVNHPARCGTLHSFLQVRSPLDYLKPPEPLDAKLIIVDECSMIDPPLFARLLESISEETTLVLMGDRNQLPAVSGGSIFADLIDTNVIPTTHLTKCMRSDRKEILDLAQGILKGDIQDIRTIDLGFSENSIEQIYNKVWAFVKKRDFDTFRILSTLRKGPLGVDALNGFLHEKFSQQTDRFPIMIKRNDARTGLSNGETGILVKDEALFSNGRRFALNELPPFDFAYCLSVHKSQGSEYDDVLFLIPDGSEAFGREVIYTAVTRARNSIAIDGNPSQIATALKQTCGKASRIREKIKNLPPLR